MNLAFSTVMLLKLWLHTLGVPVDSLWGLSPETEDANPLSSSVADERTS